MLENDSSPLDGQQEKTRAYHTPVARQQEIPNRHLAARMPESLKIVLAFFPFSATLFSRKLCDFGVRQIFCRFFCFRRCPRRST
jgi:hypothetical protein